MLNFQLNVILAHQQGQLFQLKGMTFMVTQTAKRHKYRCMLAGGEFHFSMSEFNSCFLLLQKTCMQAIWGKY